MKKLNWVLMMVVFLTCSCTAVKEHRESKLSDDQASPDAKGFTTEKVNTVAEVIKYSYVDTIPFTIGYVSDIHGILPQSSLSPQISSPFRIGNRGSTFLFNKQEIFHATMGWYGMTNKIEELTEQQSGAVVSLFKQGSLSAGVIYYYPNFHDPKGKKVVIPGVFIINSIYLPYKPEVQNFLKFQLNDPNFIVGNSYVHNLRKEIVKKTHSAIRNLLPTDSTVYFVYDYADEEKAYYEGDQEFDAVTISQGEIEKQEGAKANLRVYNATTSFGYLKILSAKDLKDGEYTAKDIIVISDVPLDIGPNAGLISLKPQVPDSHVILRAKNMNVVDAFVSGKALPTLCEVDSVSILLTPPVIPAVCNQWFKKYANKPVIIRTVILPFEENDPLKKREFILIAESSIEVVEDEFIKKRPQLDRPVFDLSLQPFYVMNSAIPARASIYGAKGTNFARLHAALKAAGINRDKFDSTFLLPFYHYDRHVNTLIKPKYCLEAFIGCKEDYLVQQLACRPRVTEAGTLDKTTFDECVKVGEAPQCGELQSQCDAQKETSINAFILNFIKTNNETLMLDAQYRK